MITENGYGLHTRKTSENFRKDKEKRECSDHSPEDHRGGNT